MNIIYEVMSNNSKLFYVEKYLGHGSYGKVAQCTRLDTNEKIAVKILRSDMTWAGKREAAVLKKIRKLDHDKNNLVRFHESFEYKGHICLAFEMLHLSIYDFMSCRDFKPMHLTEIRVITQQMLVALNALKSIGLSHADIKPDNIMLVNQKHFPFRVKLIDFGLADNVSKLPTGTMIQATGYRAPEVILGLPLDQGVDIWSLACVLGFMYLGRNLYPTRCSYQVMRVIVELQGMPDDDLLDTGIYTSWFFKMKDTTEYEDTLAYLSLLKRMLHVDPRKRITTSKAMGHRFINMKHFPNDANPNPYMSAAFLTIKKSQLQEPSVKFKHFVTSSEVVSFKEESISMQRRNQVRRLTMGQNKIDLKSYSNVSKKRIFSIDLLLTQDTSCWWIFPGLFVTVWCIFKVPFTGGNSSGTASSYLLTTVSPIQKWLSFDALSWRTLKRSFGSWKSTAHLLTAPPHFFFSEKFHVTSLNPRRNGMVLIR
uniref:Protein kinase domain-containing protein n=1 Tax=Seriola dumerili TaxID=41447 RepID=A0A3B4UQR4_SERDU